MPSPFSYPKMLRVLLAHQVDFVVIGGVCATLHGSSVLTADVDIVASRHSDNLKRLEAALTELNAYYREHPRGRFLPDAERLDTKGHHLLMTDLGALDVLGTVTGGRGYEELLPETIQFTIEGDLQIPMLNLPMLILLKQETNRVKDRLIVPILRQLLLEKQEGTNKENADSEN